MKSQRCYVIYSDERYFEIARCCAKSIRSVSSLPIVAYMLNSDLKIDIEGTRSVRWDCELMEDRSERYVRSGTNFYINRMNKSIYSMLMQRPLIVKHALNNFAECVAYVDCDSVATKFADRIFSYFDEDSCFPAFVEGIYAYLSYGSRGVAGMDEPEETLEYPACFLFGVDQSVRKKYRQTGYFVAGRNCLEFLEEWHDMCSDPQVLLAPWLYAPFNEETILNVLLWKKGIFEGLPYLYVNGGLDSISDVREIGFSGEKRHVRQWLAIPAREEELLFYHGEKDLERIEKMIEYMK